MRTKENKQKGEGKENSKAETVRHFVTLFTVVIVVVSIEAPFHCKQAHQTADAYVSNISDAVQIGLLFRSLVGNEDFWLGDVCIYLGTEGLKHPLKRLWCFRSEKFVTVDSFEDLQVFGVTNYPGERF